MPTDPTGETLQEIARHVTGVPPTRPGVDASVHLARSQWARDSCRSQRYVRQRGGVYDLREAVGLAIAARAWPSRWTAGHLAEHTGYAVADVELVLAGMVAEGVISRPTSWQVDLLTPALVARLTGDVGGR